MNFSNFSASDIARFNSLLDEEPCIDGVPLPKNTKVIGLIDSTAYQDASLYSRFGTAIEECPIKASEMTVPFVFEEAKANEKAPLIINCYNSPTWRATLLGSWSIKT